MPARVSNIVIEQGASFTNTYFVEDSNNTVLNLAGYTGTATLAKHPASSSKTSFTVSIVSSTGSVSIGLTSGKTSSLKPGRYVYDVLLTGSDNAKIRIVEGMALVTAGVSTQ